MSGDPQVDPGFVPAPDDDQEHPESAFAPPEDSEDASAFLINFAQLPSIIQAKERLLERGYGDDDPVMTIIEVLSLYDRRQEILTSRQLNAMANVIHRLETLQGEVGAIRPQIDSLQQVLEFSQDQGQVVSDQFGKVLRSNAEVLPQLEKAYVGVGNAAKLIENRSTKAVILSYLAPALTLITGLIIGVVLAKSPNIGAPESDQNPQFQAHTP